MEHPADPVSIHYKLSEKEYLEACHLLVFPDAATKLKLAANAALLAVAFPALLALAGLSVAVACAATASLLALLAYALHFGNFVQPRRFYRGDRRFREGMSLAFTPEHVCARSKLVEARVDWRLYTDVIEGDRLYLLVYGRDMRMMTPIPKRAFKSRRQEQAFREIVFPRFDRKLAGHRPDQTSLIEDDYQPASFQPPDWR